VQKTKRRPSIEVCTIITGLWKFNVAVKNTLLQ